MTTCPTPANETVLAWTITREANAIRVAVPESSLPSGCVSRINGLPWLEIRGNASTDFRLDCARQLCDLLSGGRGREKTRQRFDRINEFMLLRKPNARAPKPHLRIVACGPYMLYAGKDADGNEVRETRDDWKAQFARARLLDYLWNIPQGDASLFDMIRC